MFFKIGTTFLCYLSQRLLTNSNNNDVNTAFMCYQFYVYKKKKATLNTKFRSRKICKLLVPLVMFISSGVKCAAVTAARRSVRNPAYAQLVHALLHMCRVARLSGRCHSSPAAAWIHHDVRNELL